MTRLNVVHFAVYFPAILTLAGCSSNTTPSTSSEVGGNSSSTGGTTQVGTSSVGGKTGVGGTSQAAGTTSISTGGTSSATGGRSTSATTGPGNTGGSSTAATGGTVTNTGGKTSTGGSASVAGGSSGGNSPTGGTSSAAGGSTGGKTAMGGTTSTTSNVTGGTNATGGSVAATGGSTADQNGKPLAKSGDKTSTANDYLNLGNVRLINNNWGSVALSGCSAPMSVTATDSSLSWTFNRGDCKDDGSHPDYPEIEFGVAPFGKTSPLRTTPPFSTTSLLPIQVKNIQSASVSIGNFNINLQNNTNWNINIEFWLSKLDPLTNNDAQAYVEIMGLWGVSAGALEWKCNASGSVTSGGKTYNLCHQSDSWGSAPYWRFFQFQASNLSQNFSGTVDVKAFLDWFYNSNYGSGASKDYYLTRIEIGSEIDDKTSGSCTISNVSFTINGTTQTPVFAK